MENIDEINKLKKKNERLKRENEIITGMHNSSNNRFNKLYSILQEIKAIAEEDCEFCDDIGGCMDNECRRVRILDLITKAEEE